MINNQRGAALVLVLLFIVLLSVSAIAGLGRVNGERRSTGNLGAEVDAYTTAQVGIATFLRSTTSAPGASLDTTITGLPGGTAAISVRRLRVSSGTLPALYIIKSYAIQTGAIRFDASTPSAERTVAQFAIWKRGSMVVDAAWTSLTGLTKTGGSGIISGADQCGVAAPVAGVSVPASPGYVQSGGSSVPSGSPNIDIPAGDPAGYAAIEEIDWDAIVNRGAIGWNYSGTTWPGSLPSGWPTIFINNSSPVSLSSGRGLLVVKGDLTIGGSQTWDGVILVGGTLTSTGDNTVQGAVVTGLNLKLGMAVGVSDLGNGTKTYVYNSCNVANALQSLGSLVGLGNARMDNWPSY
jgi:Tfp pilus assembly protein PilX